MVTAQIAVHLANASFYEPRTSESERSSYKAERELPYNLEALLIQKSPDQWSDLIKIVLPDLVKRVWIVLRRDSMGAIGLQMKQSQHPRDGFASFGWLPGCSPKGKKASAVTANGA